MPPTRLKTPAQKVITPACVNTILQPAPLPIKNEVIKYPVSSHPAPSYVDAILPHTAFGIGDRMNASKVKRGSQFA